MDAKTVASAIILTLLGCATGYEASSGQISTLQSQVSILSTENAALKTDADKVPGLLKQIASLTNEISAVGSDFAFKEVSFSRTEDTSSVLQHWISRANSTIRVAIYSFTQDDLGDALVLAKGRGIDIQVYMESDNINGSGSEYLKLKSAGIQVKSDVRSALMHHKYMVVDGKILATGSYNWSASAEDSNDENLIIIKSKFLAEDYTAEFTRLWALGV